MTPVSDARVKSALQSAEDAFWAAVAQEFPEATSGDLDPGMAVSLKQTMERAIRAWLDYNITPESSGRGEL
jgi:hypothetical protein